MTDFIQTCKDFQAAEQKLYFFKNANNWLLSTTKPKNFHSVQALRAILAEAKTASKDKTSILTAAKKIKSGYDAAYDSAGKKKKIWQAIKLFFTGKREKDEVHNLYKQIKTELKIPATSNMAKWKKTIREEAAEFSQKNKSLLDFFSLPASNKKEVCKLLFTKAGKETDWENITEKSQNFLTYFTLKMSPEDVFNHFLVEVTKVREAVEGSQEVDSSKYESLSKQIHELTTSSRVHYTIYKGIYNQSNAPRPWEGIKLAFVGKTKRDKVEAIYQKSRELLKNIQSELEERKNLTATLEQGALRAADKLIPDSVAKMGDKIGNALEEGAVKVGNVLEKGANKVWGIFKRK